MASVSKKIKMALAYEGMSEAELARRLGFSPAAFNQRMATDKWSADLLIQIGEVIGCTYSFGFTFPDGTEI